MVYRFICQDECNAVYKEIVKIAFEYSEHFSVCSFKYIHKKDQKRSYFDFFSLVEPYRVYEFDFELPVHYRKGQKFHVFKLNKTTKMQILDVASFDNWYIYEYPEDLAFYHNKEVWFRCISHERFIHFISTDESIVERFSNLGIGISEMYLEDRI